MAGAPGAVLSTVTAGVADATTDVAGRVHRLAVKLRAAPVSVAVSRNSTPAPLAAAVPSSAAPSNTCCGGISLPGECR